jgi:hypothetical protein
MEENILSGDELLKRPRETTLKDERRRQPYRGPAGRKKSKQQV